MTSQKTFFISYTTRTERDAQWAKWAEWVLRVELGHKTIMQEYDFHPGDNFRERMDNALKSADCVIGVLTETYMKSSNCTDEWTNADHFIPVRFDDCHPKGLLKCRVYIDLNKLDEEAAKKELIAKLQGIVRPTKEPDYPAPANFPMEKSSEINVPLDSSKGARKLIGAAALYGNKANIQVPIYKDGLKTKFHDPLLLEEMSVLEREGIICIQYADLSHISSRERNKMVSTLWNADGFKELYSEYDFLFKDASYSTSFVEGLKKLEADLEQFDPAKKSKYMKIFREVNKVGLEVNTVANYLGRYILEELNIIRKLKGTDFRNALLNIIVSLQKRTEPGYALTASEVLGSRRFEDLTMLQLKMYYDLIAQGKNILANDLLKTALNEVNANSREHMPAELIPKAIEVLLPRFHELSFENIVKLREKAKDELIEMREYIDGLALEFSPDDINSENAKLHLKKKINPSIKQLESKVNHLKISMIQKGLQNLKDIKNLTPILLATFIPNVPIVLGVGASVGLIAVDAGLEYLKQKENIKPHPLYFVLGLRHKSENI